jgi:hypothetical protein
LRPPLPVRTEGCLSNKTALTMIFKLAQAAAKSWCRSRQPKQTPTVVLNAKFNDGMEIVQAAARSCLSVTNICANTGSVLSDGANSATT